MSDNACPEEMNPHFKDFVGSLEVLNKESERGAVLVAVAMLDDILEKCIRKFLVENDDVDKLLNGLNAPLGSLLSNAEYEECRRIQKIRNRFAHDVHISFSDPGVIDLCANLNLYVKQNDETRKHPRFKFEVAAIGIILCLTNRLQYVAERRLIYPNWPL